MNNLINELELIISEGQEKNEIEFEDTNPTEKLPDLISSKVSRKIKEGAKNYKVKWKNAIALVNWALKELNIEEPRINTDRWNQYKEFISDAVEELNKARGYL